MATHSALDILNRPAMANGPYGNGVVHVGKVAPASAPATSDVLRLVRIPAGTRVDEVIIINDDCDSTTVPTITCKVGYTPVNSSDGPAQSEAYFFPASSTLLQTAARNNSASKPITFNYDVWVDLTVSVVAASFIAGAEVHCIVRGESVGTP